VKTPRAKKERKPTWARLVVQVTLGDGRVVTSAGNPVPPKVAAEFAKQLRLTGHSVDVEPAFKPAPKRSRRRALEGQMVLIQTAKTKKKAVHE
jgi:hypothetical protein